MNGNYHGTHHHAPQLRWHELPAAFARSGATPEGGWLAALLRQFRGPMHLERHMSLPEPAPFAGSSACAAGTIRTRAGHSCATCWSFR